MKTIHCPAAHPRIGHIREYKVIYQNDIFLFEECMAGDVNLFLDDSRRDVAEIEIMIAGKRCKLLKVSTQESFLK